MISRLNIFFQVHGSSLLSIATSQGERAGTSRGNQPSAPPLVRCSFVSLIRVLEVHVGLLRFMRATGSLSDPIMGSLATCLQNNLSMPLVCCPIRPIIYLRSVQPFMAATFSRQQGHTLQAGLHSPNWEHRLILLPYNALTCHSLPRA